MLRALQASINISGALRQAFRSQLHIASVQPAQL